MTGWPFTPELAEQIHARVVAATGGSAGIRDRGLLEAALNRPLAAFAGQELFPSVVEKAAALAHAIIRNHPFVDGNKRVAVVLMVTLLRLNGLDLGADDDTAEEAIVSMAAGSLDLDAFTGWLVRHIIYSQG